MKIKQQESPFPTLACKAIYLVFAAKPRKIFNKDEVIEHYYKVDTKYSKLTIVDSLLELVRLGYVIASPNMKCYALSEKTVKIRKEVTLNFKSQTNEYNTSNNNSRS